MRVVHPMELDLPDLGLVLIEDAETGEQLLADTSDPLFQQRLRAEVDARELAVTTSMRRAGVTSHRISTDQDLVQALVDMVRQSASATAPHERSTYPVMIVVAVVVGLGLAAAYYWLQRRRTSALAAAGLSTDRPRLGRRSPPPSSAAVPGRSDAAAARRRASTSDGPGAPGGRDRDPRLRRLEQHGGRGHRPQPARGRQSSRGRFCRGATGHGGHRRDRLQPGRADHPTAHQRPRGTVAAINRLTVGGGTSLGNAIIASLAAITGKTVGLPDPASPTPPPDLGYWGSATIVLLSDGEDTGGPDAVAAAELAADAGVHIETIGVGTVEGTTIEVDGYQMSTSLERGAARPRSLRSDPAPITGPRTHRRSAPSTSRST